MGIRNKFNSYSNIPHKMKELGNICTWTHDGWIRNIEVNQELKLILTLNRTQTREHKAALNSL